MMNYVMTRTYFCHNDEITSDDLYQNILMETKKNRKKSFIERIILISLESLTRRYKRILY